jgi:chromosome segregation and condensation protein ScpB
VRGVNSDGAVASLIGRGLIEEVGRAPGPGRPALFGTTIKFLEHFGLSKPSDLPPLQTPELTAALGLDEAGDEEGEDPDDEDAEDQAADRLTPAGAE